MSDKLQMCKYYEKKVCDFKDRECNICILLMIEKNIYKIKKSLQTEPEAKRYNK